MLNVKKHLKICTVFSTIICGVDYYLTSNTLDNKEMMTIAESTKNTTIPNNKSTNVVLMLEVMNCMLKK